MRIEYKNDVTRATEEMEGSDGRANVSARTDERAYYNSRDRGQCYAFPWLFNAANNTEYAAYLKNTSATLTIVVSSIGLNAEVAMRFRLDAVTGTAGGSGVTTITPGNCNLSSSNAADASAIEATSAATGITGLTQVTTLDFAWVVATGHEEFRLGDRVRLGQNDAVAVQVLERASEGDCGGIVFFYFE